MKLPGLDRLGSVGFVGERKALSLLCLGFYTTLFFMIGLSARSELPEWVPVLRAEIDKAKGRDIALRELAYLRWIDNSDTMVVTFDEVVAGARSGPVKRQYWVRQGANWKIFFEGVIG